MKKYYFFTLFFSLILNLLVASSVTEINKITVSGTVKDFNSGESMPGASIYIDDLKTGTITNNYGFYSITISAGEHTMKVSFVGYKTITKVINLKTDLRLDFKLEPSSTQLTEVEVKSRAADENVSKAEMSVVKIDSKTIGKLPALMGEVDVLKTIQMLPGVHSSGEGSTGYTVRGGGTDQNLVLMDEAPVYNTSHLMGFFSVFNNDAVRDLKLYKGDIPAEYGGRLASLLTVNQRDGNMKKLSGSGGIGLISSRLMLEGPIKKDKASFLIAGRRSYADLFLPLASNKDLKNNKLFFYDMNAKVNWEINEKNRIFISTYVGRDVIKVTQGGGTRLDWGNQTFTFRWNRIISKKIFANFTALRSNYTYDMTASQANQEFLWKSKMNVHSAKIDFGYFLNTNNSVKFGVSASFHQFMPGSISSASGVTTGFNEVQIPNSQSFEYSAYIANEQKIGALIRLNYGLRFNLFQSVGDALVYHYNSNFNSTDSVKYDKWESYNFYHGLEPRCNATYLLNEFSSLKASYSRTMQFVQLASNATYGNPFSVWFPSSPNVKPQTSDQIALGYFRNFKNNIFETSVEVFYKKMNNQIDFVDHAELFLNPKLEGELRFGKGEAYGIEFFIRKQTGKLTGWISYSYSKSLRYFPDINNGKTYLSPFDKPHDVAVVASYEFNKRISVSANWVFSSGTPATYPTGKFQYGNMTVPVYSDRNAFRIPAYHRMDVGITLNEKEKPNRKWHYNWVLSVYNVYNRHNVYSYFFGPAENDPSRTTAIKVYLFAVIPSLTFNFNF